MHKRFALLLACSLAAVSCATATPLATPFGRGPATGYLAMLQDLGAAGFTTTTSPHAIGLSALRQQLDATADLSPAPDSIASAEYFRQTPDLMETNGPIDVITTAEVFSSDGDASRSFAVQEAWLAAMPTSMSTSAGTLGDQAAANVESRMAPTQIIVLQYGILWRVDNIVELLIVRQRYDGSGITDADAIAQTLTARLESGPLKP